LHKVKGIDELNRQLESLKSADFTPTVLEGGEKLKNLSQRNAPEETGLLKRSHEVVVEAVNSVKIVVGAIYSSIVEFRQPYLRPAIDAMTHMLPKIIGEKVQEILNDNIK
jgi:hypothetical protein